MSWTKIKKAHGPSTERQNIFARIGKINSTLHIPQRFVSKTEMSLDYYVNNDKIQFGIVYKKSGEGEYKQRVGSTTGTKIFTLPQKIAKQFSKGIIRFRVVSHVKEADSESFILILEAVTAPSENP